MRPGDIIGGKYRIESALGEGGMGVVYAASHTEIGNRVAIKVLRREALSSEEVPKRFRREAQAMGMLRSEHVIKVHDVGTLPGGEPYMVMEMLHGTDLGSRLKQGPVPPHQAVDYVMQACEGLAEAHAVGMVHRDIKPGNLFVTSRPNGTSLVKVLDFGIATAASGSIDPRLTSTQSVMGSPSYMSPEQLKGARDVDARSDIWSLGVTLYELITGNQPFTGNTLTALSLAIVTDAHERPINMPASMIPIIDKCLEKERERRFQNVAELAAALAPLFPGTSSTSADMVRGSYSVGVVPPTLIGLEANQLLGSQATMTPQQSMFASARPSTSVQQVGMTSTTSLASGETGTRIPAKSKKWVWLMAGLATIALGIGVGVVVGKGNNNEAKAAEQPSPPPSAEPKTVKPDPQPEPPKPEPVKPVEETKVDPPKVDPVPEKVDPPKVDPPKDTKVVVRKPPKPPKPPKPGDGRKPVEPPDYGKPGDPTKVDPPKPPDPPKPKPDPGKQPCAPNDPRCGL